MAKTLYTGSQTVTTVGGGNGYKFELEVIENSTDTSKNISSITINQYCTGLNGYYYSGHSAPTATIKVDGGTKKTSSVPNTSTSKTLINSWTGDIEHDSDGTKSIRVTAYYENNGDTSSYMPNGSKITAESVSLTTIPRGFTKQPTISVQYSDAKNIITWGTSETASKIVVYLNGSKYKEISVDATTGTFEVSGTPETTTNSVYYIATRKDTGVDTTSEILNNMPFYNYPYIKSVSTSELVIGSEQTITLYNPLGRTVTVYMKKDSTNGTQLYSGTTSSKGDNVSYKFTPNASTLYSSIPSATSGNAIYYCTYSNQIVQTKSGTYKIKGTEVPTFSDSNWSYTADLTALTNNNQVIINNYSTVAFKINTAATSNYGATISKYILKWGNKSTTITGTSGSVSKGNGNVLTIIAYDSRGLSKETTKTLSSNYIAYTDITISSVNTPRDNGVEAGVKLSLSGSLFNGKFGSDGATNALYSAKYYVSTTNSFSGSGYTIPISNFNVSNGTFTLNNYVIHANGSSGGFTVGQEYYVKIEIKDAQGLLATATSIGKVTDGKFSVDMFKDSNGDYHVGVNGLADSNYAAKVHGDTDIEGALYLGGHKILWIINE